MPGPSGYAVIDLETTGPFASRGDRVVELAVVTVDGRGTIEDSWSTLVNPRRPLAATEIHGIRADDVLAAPVFADLAPLVLESLAGRVMVGHNVRFDLGFLVHECAEAGYELEPPPTVCTMEQSTHFLPGSSRKLADCCRAAGVEYNQRHAALADATAAARLLAYYLAAVDVVPWTDQIAVARSQPGLVLPPGLAKPTLLARELKEIATDPWLDRLTSELPRLDPDVEAYVDVLDAALVDGYLAGYERDQLATLAAEMRLTVSQLDQIHRGYFAALCTAAWADGDITFDEQAQLTMIAAALTIPTKEAVATLVKAETSPTPIMLSRIQLAPRDRVTFVEPLGTSAPEWGRRVSSVGLIVVDDVASARYVVTADPDDKALTPSWTVGAVVVTEWAFDAAVEQFEMQRSRRGLIL
jgi:DNA polymerase-3 subunit epsilon